MSSTLPDREEMMKAFTRRYFLKDAGIRLGASALSFLVGQDLLAAGGLPAGLPTAEPNPLAPKAPMFAPKAKSVIYLFMAGAPSHLDMLDYKPKLQQFNGDFCPEEYLKGQRFAFIKGVPRLLGSPYKFPKSGKCGAEISEILPHLQGIADDIAIVKSISTTQFNHAPAQIYMNCGFQIIGRPSMGSWLTYGLGSECADLPGFVVLLSGQNQPDGGKSCWGSGFLPTVYQGVEFRSSGDPVLYLSNPKGVDEALQKDTLDEINALNKIRQDVTGDPEIATRINSFEMAFRMQSSAPELMDLSKETQATLDMYGAVPGKPSFANNCLLARRLVERGVRFVQLYHEAWDQHEHLVEDISENCRDTDRACAGLVQDLKQRGMLDDTLVIWGGEFGRTPMVQASAGGVADGRDHHPNAFTMWLAGGGMKRGFAIGESDELGFNVIEDKVHVHDLHATILKVLGFDHTKMTFKFQGRNFRLTDVSGNVVEKMLA